MADKNSDNNYLKLSEQYNTNLVTEMIFEFVEGSELSSGSSFISGDSDDNGDLNFEDDESSGDPEENRSFWESQEQLLTENLYRTSSVESKIRKATKAIVKEMKGVCCCDCGVMAVDGCRRCLQTEITDQLRRAGYNCGICKAKWVNLKEIPAGEHTYIEVLDTSNSKKGVLKVIIELNFRAEFEMVKGSQEYNRLISRLPEIYVGKTERLQSLIKILCSASKKCMKDQKLHIAPWRKLKYMQAKWHGAQESKPVLPPEILSVVECSNRLSRPMVSLLTFDLVESLNTSSGLHSMAIKVL